MDLCNCIFHEYFMHISFIFHAYSKHIQCILNAFLFHIYLYKCIFGAYKWYLAILESITLQNFILFCIFKHANAYQCMMCQ